MSKSSFVRLVIDAVKHCNLRCRYCHPGDVWEQGYLSVDSFEKLLEVATAHQLLDITLTGGEITLHPQFRQLMEATRSAKGRSVQLITNATQISDEILDAIHHSGVTRVCTSIDSVNPALHNVHRGKSFEAAMAGLRRLSELPQPRTVISVATASNYQSLTDLSEYLFEKQLADQHHIGAACYSGEAIQNYESLRLDRSQFIAIQNAVDDVFPRWLAEGRFVTFNSYWPASGEYSRYQPRLLTMAQFVEQHKGRYVVVRSSGQVMPTHMSWGRETVGTQRDLIANSPEGIAGIRQLLSESGSESLNPRLQLRREIESKHKFQLDLGSSSDDRPSHELLSSGPGQVKPAWTIPIASLIESPILTRPLSHADDMFFGEFDGETTEGFCVSLTEDGTVLIYNIEAAFCLLMKGAEYATWRATA